MAKNMKKLKEGKSKDGHNLKKSGSIVKNKKHSQTMHGRNKMKSKMKNAKKGKELDKKKPVIKIEPKKEGARKRKLTADGVDADTESKRRKSQSDVVPKLMTIYETLRRRDVTSDERCKLIDEVLIIATEKELQVANKHDTVRVLEMCMKFGSSKQKNQLFDLFRENLVNLVTSKYAKFLVEKFIEYGSKDQRRKIIEAFCGKVIKLIKNKVASDIIDEIYDQYANASQRAALVEEFYGPEFSIMKVASGRTADDIMNHNPEMRARIMSFMKNLFTTLCQKDVIVHNIIHHALFDYFKYANLQYKMEVIDILKEGVVHILHTKDGAKVAMNCFWHGTVKDRKIMLKSLKTHVIKICKEEYGHFVLLALFDVMDDTVLVRKILFPEIISNVEELILDQYGRKVLLYLLKPRDRSYFLPDVIEILKQGDGNTISKKTLSVRQTELRSGILPDLLTVLVKNIEDILINKSAAVVLLAALEVSYGLLHSHKLLQAIVQVLQAPLESCEKDEDKRHPVSDACGHWVVRSIIKQDKMRLLEDEDHVFSKLLCDAVPTGYFANWVSSNRSAFVLVSLLESGIDSVILRVKKDLKEFLATTLTSEEPSTAIKILRKACNDSI